MRPVTKGETDRPLDPGDAALEQADHRMAATTPLAWVSLIALFALVSAAVVWSIFGRAPEIVQGQGLIMPPSGTVEIGVPFDGVVESVGIDVGASVREGQVVAVVLGSDGVRREITSSVSGVVTEVYVRRGMYDRNGEALALIEPPNDELVVTAYIDAADGKSVDPGMKVYISPSSAPAAQYGSMLGHVRSVSASPVDQKRLELMVGRNPALIQRLTGSGAVVEVQITLDPDPSTPTGFDWTSGMGPEYPITSGTLSKVQIVTQDRRPISRLLG